MLGELRMLDDYSNRLCGTGHIGEEYILQRLLRKQTTLPPRLNNLSRIASRLALDGANAAANAGVNVNNTDNYLKHIRVITSLVICQTSDSMDIIFRPGSDDAEYYFEYELLTAAAYTRKLSIVRELCEQKNNTQMIYRVMGNPYIGAALGGGHCCHRPSPPQSIYARSRSWARCTAFAVPLCLSSWHPKGCRAPINA